VSPRAVAEWLNDGLIVARLAGRSEFGPRALGGRSLLASPLLAESKRRLNAIKGRQEWRPVAPIIPEDRVAEFFDGPAASPYMNLAHVVREPHRRSLIALEHPDFSTRAQTLRKRDDEYLYDLLGELSELCGYPILVNTSLNGPGEPIVETPDDAISFFLRSAAIDILMLDDLAIRRPANPSLTGLRMAPDAFVMVTSVNESTRYLLVRRDQSMEISRATFDFLRDGDSIVHSGSGEPSPKTLEELREGMGRSLLICRERA
jgi:Carbamoyltransferase C-terminus